jgi:hypothetical protein
MLTLKQFRSNAALMMAVVMPIAAIIPMLTASHALAQSTSRSIRIAQSQPTLFNRARISAGAVIPVDTEKSEKIDITPGETKQFTLIIPQSLRSSNGALLVPAGSKVEGEFRPVDQGTQFVANTLVLTDSRRYAIDATSPVIVQRETIRQGVSPRAIWQGALGGAAGAAILAGVTGDKRISVGEVLIGSAVGAAGGAAIGRKEKEIITISPSQDLSLTLNQSLPIEY